MEDQDVLLYTQATKVVQRLFPKDVARLQSPMSMQKKEANKKPRPKSDSKCEKPRVRIH